MTGRWAYEGRYAFESDKAASSLLSPDLVYREDFDRRARELRACMGDATYRRLKHDFDVSYFAIGSLSNGSVVAGMRSSTSRTCPSSIGSSGRTASR